MDLDETWQVGLRPEETKPCMFPAKSRHGFRRQREKWVAEAFFSCVANHASLLWISLHQFPPNFRRSCVHVAARDIWFHIPERFPLRRRISRKNSLLGYFRVPCLCSAYCSRKMFCDAGTAHFDVWIVKIGQQWRRAVEVKKRKKKKRKSQTVIFHAYAQTTHVPWLLPCFEVKLRSPT